MRLHPDRELSLYRMTAIGQQSAERFVGSCMPRLFAAARRDASAAIPTCRTGLLADRSQTFPGFAADFSLHRSQTIAG
jgi:hypothetical protein